MRLLLVLVVLACARCAGAVVYVDCRAPGPTHNGSSWLTAYATITQALAANPAGADVWVKAGAYPEGVTLRNYHRIYGGFLGFETSPEQRVAGAFPSVIDGGGERRCVYVERLAQISIDGFTIRNGRADRGAGIRCDTNADVTISGCTIENCRATEAGGGVYYGFYTIGSMTRCTLIRNQAPNGGGAVIEYHSYPTLRQCVFARNRAAVSGGAVHCPFHSGALLVNCTLAHNTADLNGGGVYTVYGGPVTLNCCIVVFNSAPMGGGLYGDGGASSVTLTGCDFYANPGGDWGGWVTIPPAYAGNFSADPLFLFPESDEYHLAAGTPCAGVGAYPADTVYRIARIGCAKRLGIEAQVELRGKVVSCVEGGTAYLQETDGCAGVAVAGMTGCAPGDVIRSVTATVASAGVLTASAYQRAGASYAPKPIGARISWLTALMGVRTRTWGTVTRVDANGYTLSDGGAELRVRSTKPVQVGQCVTLTGVLLADGAYRNLIE